MPMDTVFIYSPIELLFDLIAPKRTDAKFSLVAKI